MNNRHFEAYLGRADAYREQENLDAAIRDYEAANNIKMGLEVKKPTFLEQFVDTINDIFG